MMIITNKQLADLLNTPYREVSQKLGGLDVSASGSRAQLSVLEPLVSVATRINFHFHARKQSSNSSKNSRLMKIISLTFQGEKDS